MEPQTITMVLVVVLISVAVVIWVIWMYLERSKPTRIKRARSAQKLSSEDEAHNAVVSTKSIINVMRVKGRDVTSAEILVNRAELALDSGDYKKAIRLAEEAREELNNSSFTANVPVKKLEEKDPLEVAADRRVQADLVQGKEKVERLPENYLESKFEMDIARELMDEKGTPEAERFLNMADICFQDEDYTGALKYAIQCKKAISEEDTELLSAQRIGKRPVKEVREIRYADASEKDMECPECGNSVSKKDKFCDQCGEKLDLEPKCPECGVDVSPSQKFCSECGAGLDISNFECPECGQEIEGISRFCPGCGVEFLD